MTDNDRFHFIVTQVYDNEGVLIKQTNAFVPGDYEYDEMEKKYLAWLDERRGTNEN